LLQFFREKLEAVLEGRLYPEFPLDTEVALYNNFILQLECEVACSKEKMRGLAEK